MLQRIAGRLVQGIVVLLVVSVLIFVVGHMIGDPIMLLLPQEATVEQIETLRQSMGLNDPLPVQYQRFIAGTLRGDFGRSLVSRRRVSQDIVERLPATSRLGAVSLIFGFVVAIPMGIMAAYRHGTIVDTVVNVIAALGQSTPAFLVGILLIELFSVKLRLLPAAGDGNWIHYILPAVTLALFSQVAVVRILRSSMLEILRSDYIKTARSKGLSEPVVLIRHAFRNALIPLLGIGGLIFAGFMTGTVVVETVFAWPGVGRLTYQSIIRRDFPMIQALTLMATALVVTVNIIVDMLYMWADPRIRNV